MNPVLARAHRRARRLRRAAGLTVLELIIVIAVIGMGAYLGVSAFRTLTHAALDEDVNDLSNVIRRTQVLAVEAGMPMRLVLDFDKQGYWVEVCEGDPTLVRSKEEQKVDERAQAEALEESRQRLAGLPAGQIKAATPEDEAKIATALAGKQVGGRLCRELGAEGAGGVGPILSLDSDGRDLKRRLTVGKGVKFREVWVQHLESSATGGQVSISFFPLGWSEKAIIELGSDDAHIYSLLIHGLTGRLEVREGALRSPDDHMLRDAKGERVEER